MGKDTPNIPNPPDAAKTYQQGIDVYLKNLPTQLAAEQKYQDQYSPQNIERQLGYQSTYGPSMYQQQIDAIHQFDPESAAIRPQLAQAVSKDLSSGYALPDDLKSQIENDIRGAQIAHGGSTIGNAPISAEAATGAQFRQNLYQQHLQNAGQFLSTTTPEQQALAIQPVSAPNANQFVNPNAGYQGQQFALNNYQNLLARTAASGSGNPWLSALGGAAQGYASTGSPWGAVAGGVGGYASGGGWG